MSRIVEVKEELFDGNGNVVDSYIRKQYFKTNLGTEVEIELNRDFWVLHMVLTPDEDDFFWEETLDAIVRYLGHTDFYITENSDSVTVNFFEGYIIDFLEELANQVDKKLEKILEEKGIDPNAKNDNFLNLYSEDFNYDLYEDIRGMYEEDEENPYKEHEYTELIEKLDDSVFSESIEEVRNDGV